MPFGMLQCDDTATDTSFMFSTGMRTGSAEVSEPLVLQPMRWSAELSLGA